MEKHKHTLRNTPDFRIEINYNDGAVVKFHNKIFKLNLNNDDKITFESICGIAPNDFGGHYWKEIK